MAMVIVGNDLDWTFEDTDIEAAVKLIHIGATLRELEEFLERDIIEIIVLVDELIKQRRVPEVKHNLFGRRLE